MVSCELSKGQYPGVVQPKGIGTLELLELIPEIFKAIGQQVGLMGQGKRGRAPEFAAPGIPVQVVLDACPAVVQGAPLFILLNIGLVQIAQPGDAAQP